MSKSISTAVALDGIPLEVHDTDQYLEILWHVLRKAEPAMKSVLLEIQQLLGRMPQPLPENDEDNVSRIVGYHGDDVAFLIDREWHESEENEFDVLLEYLRSRPELDARGSVFLFGAGACRLGDYLASVDTTRPIICSDLSWLLLFFGRALIENKPTLLPGILQSERLYYRPADDHASIGVISEPSRFKASFTRTGNEVRYVVRNAFYSGAPITSNVVYIPFLLDEFSDAYGITMLIRICQQMRIGQILIIMMTCMTGRPAEQRDPALVLETLDRCGFQAEYIDIVPLPYSFSRYDYGYSRTIWKTLFVRATRIKDQLLDKIAIVSTPNAASLTKTELPHQCRTIVKEEHRIHRITISTDCCLALSRCNSGCTYSAIVRDLQNTIDITRIERAIGDLASSELIHLSAI